jgi:hypothetical protein
MTALPTHQRHGLTVNLCRCCGLDFASVEAFNKHRVGTHEYTHDEGLAVGRPDGRRCLAPTELSAAGMELDPRGRWRMALSDAERTRLQQLENARGIAGNAPGATSRASRAGRVGNALASDPPTEEAS